MDIQTVRKQYPQYSDLSDQQLANALHKKFYADMPLDEFYSKVGLHVENPAQPIVDQAKEPTGFEKFAIPVGAALSDTGRSLVHLTRLMAAHSPDAVAAATSMNAADQARTDAQEQPARDYAADKNPSSYYGLYAPTSILSMAPIGEGVGSLAERGFAGLAQSPKLLSRIAAFTGRSAATGAAYGAQIPGDTVTNIGLGAALGPAAETVGKGIGLGAKLVGSTSSKMTDLLRQMANPVGEANKTVGKILSESAPDAVLTPSPIPGVKLSAGGQSMDPGLQNLERVVRSRNIGGVQNEAVAQAQQRQNNAVIRGRFGAIASTDRPLAESSAQAHDALTQAQEARAAQENALWQQVPQDTKVDAFKTSAAMDSYINKQSVTNQRVIQRAAGDFLDDFKATISKYAKDAEGETRVQMPFEEIKDLRSTLGQSIRDAEKAGNSNAVRLLKGMDKKLLSTLGDENALLGVPEATGNAALDRANAKAARFGGAVTAQDLGDAYNAARGFTAETHGRYFTNEVRGFLEHDPAEMLDSVTRTPDNLKAYLNAASQAPDGGAKATQALRDYLMSKAVGGSSMSARGGTEKFVNGQKLADWINANRTTLSHVFSGDELQQMQKLSEAAYRNIATEAATPRVGSNTLEKFIGNQNLPGIGGKAGAVVNSIRDMLVGKYRGETEKLLRDSLLNANDAELKRLMSQAPTKDNMNALIAYMNKTKALRDKVPLLFSAAMRGSQVWAQRLLTQQSGQQ